MSPLPFTPSPRLSLGVELELQILDAQSLDLSPGAPDIFAALGGEGSRIKPEIFRSMIEINTGICADAREARRDLESALGRLIDVCGPLGLALCGGGSHPFARYGERVIYPMKRYEALLERHQWLARRVIIFGLHVHVGMRDGDHAAATINGLLPYLPHLLALSASSPFWQGEDTGLASSRITVFEAIPTAGHPCTFLDWRGFESLYDSLLNARAVRSVKDLWWDVRPHPDFGTIEVRVCDVPPTLSEAIGIVALTHSLCRWLDEERPRRRPIEPPPEWLIRENKWRASRWGVGADIVLDARGHVAPLRAEIEGVLARLRPVAEDLGCAVDFDTLTARLEGGVSYERQRRIFERTRSTRAIAEALLEEFRTDRPIER